MPAPDNPTVILLPAFSMTKARVDADTGGYLGAGPCLGRMESRLRISFDFSQTGTAVARVVTAPSVAARKDLHVPFFFSSKAEVPGIVEEIPLGLGYDELGNWHGNGLRVPPIREMRETNADASDPLALVRGTMWGLLFSALFWLPIGAGVLLWLRR